LVTGVMTERKTSGVKSLVINNRGGEKGTRSRRRTRKGLSCPVSDSRGKQKMG